MTPEHYQRMMTTDGYTDEERRRARLWMRQRELFPGDGGLLVAKSMPQTRQELQPVRQPLTATIGELLRAI